MYRFRILNGCNARILNLDIGGPSFWQIGAEGGMFDVPVPVKQLVLAPAERADVLVDFTKFAGQTLVMKNHRPPKPVSTPAPRSSRSCRSGSAQRSTSPGPPRSRPACPVARPTCRPVTTRYITLNEIDPDEPTWFLNLNGVHFDEDRRRRRRRSARWRTGSTSTSPRTPIRCTCTLSPFQVIGRTPFDAQAYEEAHEGPNGVARRVRPDPLRHRSDGPAGPRGAGLQGHGQGEPGYFTTIRAKFDLPTGVTAPQNYVYHCHIVEHEDNDMMRPFTVEA